MYMLRTVMIIVKRTCSNAAKDRGSGEGPYALGRLGLFLGDEQRLIQVRIALMVHDPVQAGKKRRELKAS